MIEPTVAEPSFTLYIGDNAKVLPQLAPESVDCVVTSPPYYGLRDYGTGYWVGGRADCGHESARKKTRYDYSLASSPIQDGSRTGTDAQPALFRDVCPSCGARRVDDQVGLESSPKAYVERLVGTFDLARRALAAHGTCWVVIGDSYSKGELCGVPWRFAFAMQDAGWKLVRDVIWYKRNPMPESAKTRPTTCHEYIFMFTKGGEHFYDWYAVREDAVWASDPRAGRRHEYAGKRSSEEGVSSLGQGSFVSVGEKRLLRSVWDIPTLAYPGAHFATFPRELVRRAVESGCPAKVCTDCGRPERRNVRNEPVSRDELPPDHPEYRPARYEEGKAGDTQSPGSGQRYAAATAEGWIGCGCTCQSRRHGVVLDPFLGSGTTAEVARDLGRHCVGIELNAKYCKLVTERRAQMSVYDLEVA